MKGPIYTLPSLEYKKLDPRFNEIRLLRIVSESEPTGTIPQRPISCYLEHVSMDTLLEYTALSYAWGESEPSAFLHINGQILRVSRNLELALQHLRKRAGIQPFWIDAISINQLDVEEKNEHVRGMRSICEHARAVIAWLGPATDGTDLAIRNLASLGEKMLSCGNLAEVIAETDSEKMREISSGITLGHGTDVTFPITPLTNIFDRGFWRRVWIIQEVMVAKALFFACGDAYIELSPLFAALNMLQSLRYPIESLLRAQYRSLIKIYERQAQFLLIGAFFFGTKGPEEAPFILRELLQVSRQSACASDPRDRVFALLGVAGDSDQLRITINYSKEYRSVFTEVAKAYFRVGNLSLLYNAVYQPDSMLPSWVPDWTYPKSSRTIDNGFGDDLPFSASGLLTSEVHIGREEDLETTLILSGLTVAPVHSVGSQWDSETSGPSRTSMAAWLSELDELSQARENRPHAAGQDIWWTPIALRRPRDSTWERRQEVLHRAYQVIRLPTTSDRSENWHLEYSEPYAYAMNHAANGRRAFTSKQGHLGLGSAGVQQGDMVCVILGLEVPVILRRLSTIRYVFIGDAYVYGIMDGEAMKNDPAIETFVLQ
ncbi:hypothetical protein MMC13_000423 [Lambiella insularis]|nr:hypothetical protein [Lambiella insularis]